MNKSPVGHNSDLVEGVLAAQRHHILSRLDLKTEPHLYMGSIQQRVRLG